MTAKSNPIQIINVPLDLGASRRGTDAWPSAFHIAGLRVSIEQLGYRVLDDVDIAAPVMGSRKTADTRMRFKNEILTVCRQLADCTKDAPDAGSFPLVIGGDHSISMGSVSGVPCHFGRQQQKPGVIGFDAHGDMNLPETSLTILVATAGVLQWSQHSR